MGCDGGLTVVVLEGIMPLVLLVLLILLMLVAQVSARSTAFGTKVSMSMGDSVWTVPKPLLLRHAHRLQLQTTFETAIPGPLGFQNAGRRVAGSANRFVAGHSCSILAYGRFHRGIAKGSALISWQGMAERMGCLVSGEYVKFTSLARGCPSIYPL